MIRAPGCVAKVLARKEYRKRVFVQIKLPSSKVVFVSHNCSAMVGRNNVYKLDTSKAGTKMNRGWRPSVRGVAMNPIDHPHGGGNGKKSNPSTSFHPWGLQNKFKKTLSKDILKKRTRSFIRMKRFSTTLTYDLLPF